MRGLRSRGRAPLAVAAIFAVPLYFASLMAASLAVDRPHVVAGREQPPTSATEATVWGIALIAPAIMLAIGLLGVALGRLGVMLSIAGAIALCLLLPVRLDAWSARHERRFPLGMDYLKDSSNSNTSSRGDWEHAARDTVVSITHWLLVLAVAAAAVALFAHLRRRRGTVASTPLEGVHAPDATPPGLG